MNITLYYVPGINETDTPVFDTKANQELFFSECERKVIASGFYPPFFQNTITLSTADFNLTTTVFNYLSLEYDGKKFYYFVQSKSYVAEDLTEISIYMDVIQTYMFDITWVYSHIDRLSIKRWNSLGILNLINRDYIRENYSSGLFDTVQQRNVYNSDYTQWVMIGISGPHGWASTDERAFLDCQSDNLDFDFKYKKYGTLSFVPFYDGSWEWNEYQLVDGEWVLIHHPAVKISAISFYIDVLSISDLFEAFVIPFNPFGDAYLTINGKGDYASYLRNAGEVIEDYLDDGQIRRVTTEIGEGYLLLTDKCTYRVNTNAVDTGIRRNTSRAALFDWHYVPALVDDSYMLVDFGNTRTRTAYPIHVSTSYRFGTAYWADVTSGTQYFNEYPLDGGTAASDNKYSTIKSTDVSLSLMIRNDAWKEYIARNKATLAGAIIQSATTTLGAGMNVRNDIGERVADSAASSSASRRNIKGQFQRARPLTTAMHKTGSEYSSQNKGMSSSANVTANPSGLIDYGINAVNLLTTPDTIKVKGEYEADTLGANALIYSQVVLCSNIEEVAHIYESVGYKVSINTSENLLQIQNRYYYDYVQCDEMNIHVTDIDTQEAIISRFRDGLRLWHTTDGVLNTKSVAGVTLEMGQVCIYDNVEV